MRLVIGDVRHGLCEDCPQWQQQCLIREKMQGHIMMYMLVRCAHGCCQYFHPCMDCCWLYGVRRPRHSLLFDTGLASELLQVTVLGLCLTLHVLLLLLQVGLGAAVEPAHWRCCFH
jgi:hypothetical protein